jgi:hypothetical protein
LRGGYAAERFVPNVSSGTGGGIALRSASFANLQPSLAPSTKLEAGMAQRAHLGAAVPLGKKHWTLLTGAELTAIAGNTARETPQQYQSYLPGTAASNLDAREPQQGRYRMTTAGVPVQLRYEGRKNGWGVYAAVGSAVNVLIRNTTQVGSESVTNDGSYRRVLMTARGSAGVRYAPAGGQWQLALGPEAETGLSTLNSNPVGKWGERTRPYAIGLAASIEFGSKTELVP